MITFAVAQKSSTPLQLNKTNPRFNNINGNHRSIYNGTLLISNRTLAVIQIGDNISNLSTNFAKSLDTRRCFSLQVSKSF